jgi:hypothetical protein
VATWPTGGGLYLSTSLCAPGTGPCISTCHSLCNYSTSWVMAYQNYKDCKGTHLYTCTSHPEATSTIANGYCPTLFVETCNGASWLGVAIRESGPACQTGGLDGCKHGHGTVALAGCLNRAALNSMGAAGLNRVYANLYRPESCC